MLRYIFSVNQVLSMMIVHIQHIRE